MKRDMILIALILGVCLTLTACTDPNNAPKNSSPNSSSNSQVTNEQNSSALENSEISDSTPSEEMTEDASSAEGGNSDTAKYIEVTVSEDKYFYENHEISFEELVEVLDGLDENTSVKISDENATLKAYESLTKALEERKITFEAAS